eukprot:1145840-Pelagomonas_calceolata.AAC.3
MVCCIRQGLQQKSHTQSLTHIHTSFISPDPASSCLAGRMRCERAFYTITPSGGVCVFAPPPELSALMMPEALVGMLTRSSAAKAAAAQEKQLQQQQQQQELKMGEGKAGSGPQQPQLPSAGGMRMGLSKEVRDVACVLGRRFVCALRDRNPEGDLEGVGLGLGLEAGC